MLPINRHPSAKDLRSFGRLWFPLFVLAIGIVLWWRFALPTSAFVVWGVGAAVAVAVVASLVVARAVFVGLMIVTYPIGLVVSTLALAILFYGVFTPLGWIMRLAGRDPLRLRTRDAPSQWQPHPQDDNPERIFRQF